jgi:hypothetical protein
MSKVKTKQSSEYSPPWIPDPWRPYRVLISYHFFGDDTINKQLKRLGGNPKVFLDSGAFSAKNQGVEIKVEKYAEWLAKYQDLFECYANLDVIGDDEGTWKNQLFLESQGLAPVPVFHVGEPWKSLDRLLERYDYIALGGMVGPTRQSLAPWCVQCFKRARETGRVIRFHGFGMTKWDILMSLPWYSVDSTAWNAVVRFARLRLFDPLQDKFMSVLLRGKSAHDARRVLRYYGGHPDCFISQSTYDRNHALAVSARSWRTFESYCQKRVGLMPGFNGDYDGLHIYLAEATIGNLLPVDEALT